MEMYGMTGERLGTIGQPQETDTTPDWQKALSSKPSISIRKSIAWKFDPPSEDTSTLVLTALSGTFVDIRFPEPMQSPSLFSNPSFWAFSGVATTTFDPIDIETSMPCAAHTKFTHEIDTSGRDINDEGDMFLLQNGDCIEVGQMLNPSSGQIELYKEYWTSPALTDGELRKRPCVVAKTIEESSSVVLKNGGVMIRVGDYCQGILQREGQDFLVERWHQVAPAEEQTLAEGENFPKWWKDWRSNTPEQRSSVALPCLWLCDENRHLGDETDAHGTKWKIVELLR